MCLYCPSAYQLVHIVSAVNLQLSNQWLAEAWQVALLSGCKSSENESDMLMQTILPAMSGSGVAVCDGYAFKHLHPAGDPASHR